MKKNPNGYGSVYKLSGKNRRKPFVAKITIGWDYKKNGDKTQKYKVIGYFATRKEASAALYEYWNNPQDDKKDLTLNDIYELWSKSHYEKIEEISAKHHAAAYKHLKPLYNRKISELRTIDFQKIIDNMAKKYKCTTIKSVKAVVCMIYGYLIKNDFCDKNYGTFIEVPKNDIAKRKIFSEDDINLLWENVNLPFAKNVLILIYTGMRANEFISLAKSNIDLEKKIIVHGSKTKAGKNRVIPIVECIMPFVQEIYDNSYNEIKIFKLSYTRFKKKFTDLMNSLKIEGVTPHSTRHTFATIAAKNGMNPTALQKIIGHSNYSTTANIYTHVETDTLIDEMKKL